MKENPVPAYKQLNKWANKTTRELLERAMSKVPGKYRDLILEPSDNFFTNGEDND